MQFNMIDLLCSSVRVGADASYNHRFQKTKETLVVLCSYVALQRGERSLQNNEMMSHSVLWI